MNAANYNWTEPINRASDKPGEIQAATYERMSSLYPLPSRES
jgi:hypothetical protein